MNTKLTVDSECFYIPSHPDDSDNHKNKRVVGTNNEPLPELLNLFELPLIIHLVERHWHGNVPLIDKSGSILMTSDNYIKTMEAKATPKEVVE